MAKGKTIAGAAAAVLLAALLPALPAASEQARPSIHLVGMALETSRDLKLDEAQVAQLRELWSRVKQARADAKEVRGQLEARMREIPDAGPAEARYELQQKQLAVGQQLERVEYQLQLEVEKVLTADQMVQLRQRIEELELRRARKGITLGFIMESRERLGITPQQFTRLQLLQADLIRETAPIREHMELLQMRFREGQRQRELTREEGMQAEQEMGRWKQMSNRLQEHYRDLALQVLTPEQQARVRTQ